MQNISLPTAADVDSVDQEAFIWDDLMDGTLTAPQAALIKAVLDRCPAGTTVDLSEQNAGTGKTAKFINDNVTTSQDLKIVTTDAFSDTFMTTSDFWENVNNASNCYKNDTMGQTVIEFDESGSAVGIQLIDVFNDNAVISTADLNSAPTVLGINDLSNYTGVVVPNSAVVDKDGVAISDSGLYSPDVNVFAPWIISSGFTAFEKEGVKQAMAKLFNRLPVNGIMIILQFHIPFVNQSFWSVKDAMTLTGKSMECSWLMNSETDGSGYWQAAAIKRTS